MSHASTAFGPTTRCQRLALGGGNILPTTESELSCAPAKVACVLLSGWVQPQFVLLTKHRTCPDCFLPGLFAAAQVERLRGVRVYSTAFLGVGRILFEVAPDYVKKYGHYVDVLRIWAVTLTGGRCSSAFKQVGGRLCLLEAGPASCPLQPTFGTPAHCLRGQPYTLVQHQMACIQALIF